ncbi:MAG: ADP-ribose pyrophosphatase, partial [Oscillatoriales cyanobacterium RM1_1_9]|nr:ADP-ribose pyrophosphatase [Oscillatoriales cyanobacterium RM1_1_9]
MEPDWIRWGRALQAIAQTGLHFTQNPYDVERYEQIRDLASEMFAAHSNSQPEVILDLFSQETGYATPKVDVRGVVFREG